MWRAICSVSNLPRRLFRCCIWTASQLRRCEARSPEDLGHLQPLEWCLYEQHVYFRAEPNRQPQSYAMTFTGRQVGITLYEVRHVW